MGTDSVAKCKPTRMKPCSDSWVKQYEPPVTLDYPWKNRDNLIHQLSEFVFGAK